MSAQDRCHEITMSWNRVGGADPDKVEARTWCYAEAKALLAEEPSFFADLDGKPLERLVRLIDAARDAGDTADVERIDTYIKAAHEPQQIGGRLGR